jgi:hypothetical protein
MRSFIPFLWALPLLACSPSTRPSSTAESAVSPTSVSTSAPTSSRPEPGEPGTPEPATKPEEPPAITSVWLDLYNNCPTARDYCVDDGNTLYTSLSSNATVTHSVRPGAKIRYRTTNNCTETVFTVTAESEKQKANLCR